MLSLSPFVNFKNHTALVTGQKGLIFASDYTSIIDCIWALNLDKQNLFLNVYLEKNNIEEEEKVFLVFKHTFKEYQKEDLLKGSSLYVEAGQKLFSYTDFSGSSLNFIVSYRELKSLPLKNESKLFEDDDSMSTDGTNF